MILVTGAGGKTGKALIKTLSSIESICAFVYRDEYVSIVKSLGVGKVIVGDLRDEFAVRDAMQGVITSEYAIENLAKIFEYYDQRGLAGNPKVLRWILKRESTSLEAFGERTVKERKVVH